MLSLHALGLGMAVGAPTEQATSADVICPSSQEDAEPPVVADQTGPVPRENTVVAARAGPDQ